MSLVKKVVTLLEELGNGDGDDLHPRCPGHTREQVCKALHNAAYNDLIAEVIDDKSSRHLGKGKGTKLKRYRSLNHEPIPGALTSHLQDLQQIWRHA